MNLVNSFLREWRYRGRSRTATTSKMELFVTVVHCAQLLIIIVTMSSILDVSAALDSPLYVDVLCCILL